MASLNLKHRLCLQRCELHFSLEEHLTCNKFVSDEKLLLIICAVPFPQDHGKAITHSHGFYKSVPSQAQVAQVSKRTTKQVKEPDGQ